MNSLLQWLETLGVDYFVSLQYYGMAIYLTLTLSSYNIMVWLYTLR